MHLLYTDETNFHERDRDFFLYGGVWIPSGSAASLSDAIGQLRHDAGVPEDCVLKFNPVPDGVTYADFRDLKQRIIEAAIEHGCEMLAIFTLHNLAKDPKKARRFSINQLLMNADFRAQHLDSHYLALIDRFDDKLIDRQLRDRFALGVQFPGGGRRKLARLLGAHYAARGQSHFASVVDVLLGSLRFATNAFTREEAKNMPTAGVLLRMLEPLFPRTAAGGPILPTNLEFLPKNVKAELYQKWYEELQEFLAANGLTTQF